MTYDHWKSTEPDDGAEPSEEAIENVSYYDGVTVSLNHHLSHGLQFQANYTFAEPVPLPAGTRIDMVAVFDNSAESKRQPSNFEDGGA